ncbi:MAG: hypothetical protein Q9195_001865 [Heterodermia aff. obscurata]
MSVFTPINGTRSHDPKDAVHERQNNRHDHILNGDEQIALLTASGYSGASHPDNFNYSDYTKAGQHGHEGHQTASQANGNGTTIVPKTSRVHASLQRNTDRIERLHASLDNLEHEVKAPGHHHHDIRRNLPSYDVGQTERPRLSPYGSSSSIFKNYTFLPVVGPKLAAPRTPLRVLPPHPLIGTGVLSYRDCQNMYQAGVSGKHDELKDLYFAVANAPENQSDAFRGDRLHPMKHYPPNETQPAMYTDSLQDMMPHGKYRLWLAEPEVALKGPLEKWEKETIGNFFPAVESGAGQMRLHENVLGFRNAVNTAAEDLGVENGNEGLNGRLEGVHGHQTARHGNGEVINSRDGQNNRYQTAMYGNSEIINRHDGQNNGYQTARHGNGEVINRHGEQTNGYQTAMYGNNEVINRHDGHPNNYHRSMPGGGLYVTANDHHHNQPNATHSSVNGGSQSPASTLSNMSVQYEVNAAGPERMTGLLADLVSARPGTQEHDSAVAGAHVVLSGDYGMHDGIQDDPAAIISRVMGNTDGHRHAY